MGAFEEWAGGFRWNPDGSGVIAQANGSAFEVFDADPGTDQAIEHVFHRLERRQRCFDLSL